jgi:AcrR family transcriptional regulator
MLEGGEWIQKMSRRRQNPERGIRLVNEEQKPVLRQMLKSEKTRAELLRAAEKIFARDGFEASRIEDIAAEAGRSRGAFYANFASKTEVFLTLRTLAAQKHARAVRERVQGLQDQEARYQALIGYIVEQIYDTQTQLLQIEFKLFALRHPRMQARLAEMHLEASTSVNRRELSDLFPEKSSLPAEMRCSTLEIEALLEGFALNARFSPKVLDEVSIQAIVPRLMAQIFSRAEGS